MDTIENTDFYEALDNFYKLKSIYETSIQKDKSKIIKEQNKSWREKRTEFKKLKPKCINCKRPVGTRFTQKYDSEEVATIFRAQCGSLSDPCNLNIELKSTQVSLYPEIIRSLEKDILQSKKEIINNKNKLIFNYIHSQEAVEIFDKLKETIQDTSDIMAFYLEEFIQIVDNKGKEDLLKEDIEKSYIMINDLKNLIKQFEETNNNTKIIQDVVQIYQRQLVPLLKKIQEAKYSKNSVEYLQENNTFHLNQEKYTLEDITVHYSKPEIVHFEIGAPRNVVNQVQNQNQESELEEFES
jgi:hypothetical protein